ncbi:CYTH domain-containing protein [Metabacillus arenae]|uniref:CYTH domain-containing protein n=1 Tax=Metabacillus arenae TaxID=2771434 RepID=A0A926S0A4_9BACI|nr:CYTH domain-containing protein [Metabacillus arenae]MBD1383072.1 CYTH domain-containing protein [Metabacillus arenae]
MPQEIEIEFKNLLLKEEFDRLMDYFEFTLDDFITQSNFYFDTPSFSLKEKGSALRVRQKSGQYVLTLKEPAEIGLLETHQVIEELSPQELKRFKIPAGSVSVQLQKLGINPIDIVYFGRLSTDRAEKKYRHGLIVLDHSRYLKKEDFEIEYEVTDELAGRQIFYELLDEMQIDIRETKNKIRRFYEEKTRING